MAGGVMRIMPAILGVGAATMGMASAQEFGMIEQDVSIASLVGPMIPLGLPVPLPQQVAIALSLLADRSEIEPQAWRTLIGSER